MIKLLTSPKTNLNTGAYIYDSGKNVILLDCPDDIFSQLYTIFQSTEIAYLLISNLDLANLTVAKNLCEYFRAIGQYIRIYCPSDFIPAIRSWFGNAYGFIGIDYGKQITISMSASTYKLKFVKVSYTSTECMINITKFVNDTDVKPLDMLYTGRIRLIPNPYELP